MRNPRNMLSLVVVSIISCAAGTVWTRSSTAQAQRSDARRWEYCAISDAYARDDGHGGSEIGVRISYFGNGNRTEEILADPNAGGYLAEVQNAIYRASAKLGSEGWEMVGRVSWGLNPPEAGGLFFKRLK